MIKVASTGEGTAPPGLAYLLDWYSSLASRRSVGMAANPISHQEIEAWARLRCVRPTPWQVMVLTRLDDAVLEESHKGKPKKAVINGGPEAVANMFASMSKNRRRKAPDKSVKKRDDG